MLSPVQNSVRNLSELIFKFLVENDTLKQVFFRPSQDIVGYELSGVHEGNHRVVCSVDLACLSYERWLSKPTHEPRGEKCEGQFGSVECSKNED